MEKKYIGYRPRRDGMFYFFFSFFVPNGCAITAWQPEEQQARRRLHDLKNLNFLNFKTRRFQHKQCHLLAPLTRLDL